ncbi:MAG: hypothetical protein ABIJ02_08475 [Pseudomonadota bacterium]|jgi:hypothetical protein
MQSEVLLNYVLLFILLESYEIYWQRAESILGMLAKMYHYYNKSIFLFLLMQPTFYFAIGFAMLTNFSVSAMILLFIKTADIATKILLIEQVFIKKELSKDLSIALLSPVPSILPYLGLLLYPPLIYMAL